MELRELLTFLYHLLVWNIDSAVKLRQELAHKFLIGDKVILLEKVLEVVIEVFKDFHTDFVPQPRLKLLEEGIVLDNQVEVMGERSVNILFDFIVKFVFKHFAFVCFIKSNHPPVSLFNLLFILIYLLR